MDTAKVDLRKLQLLSDRITQTIDALNQVRLSVQGVPATSPNGIHGIPPYGYPPYPYANAQSFGYAHPQHMQAALYAQSLANAWPGAPFGVPGGFAHTSPTEEVYARYGHPNTVARIGQTLPFAPWGYSPFASGFSPFAPGMY